MHHAAAPRRHHARIAVRNVPAPVTAAEVTRVLEPGTGKLTALRFRADSAADPGDIVWEGFDERGNMVGGRIELRTIVRQDEIISVAEVFVEERVDPVARRVAARFMQRTQGEGLVRVEDEEGDDQEREVDGP